MSDVNHFKADLQELEFSLFQQFRLTDLFASAPFEHMTEEDARMILKEAHTFAGEIIGPSLQSSDTTGAVLDDDGVKAPTEMGEMWRQYYGGGWNTLSIAEEHGGQGAPQLLSTAVTEMMSGANTAFYMYPALTNGAAGVIRAFGTPEQRELYAPNMENGQWGGTAGRGRIPAPGDRQVKGTGVVGYHPTYGIRSAPCQTSTTLKPISRSWNSPSSSSSASPTCSPPPPLST